MPLLDVSFVLSDPMLADTFSVSRRSESVDTNGRRVVDAPIVFPLVVGVITQEDPAELMRRDDGQMMPRQIFVASQFQLRGVATGIQPDLITWNGATYTVKRVYPYSRYGKGIYEAVAEVMEATAPVQ
jgi:hypothetical protein